MSILSTIKHDYQTLRRGAPGKRFRDYVRYRRRRRGGRFSASRIGSFAIGLFLIVGGLSIGWLPGPGGFVAIIGLALIAQEIPLIARILDRIELLVRQAIAVVKWKWRRWRSSRSKAFGRNKAGVKRSGTETG